MTAIFYSISDRQNGIERYFLIIYIVKGNIKMCTVRTVSIDWYRYAFAFQ